MNGKAQVNLVQNPSFEIYSLCPDYVDQLNRCTGWTSFGYSPDYFHPCYVSPGAGFQDVSVPNNWAGYQQPSSGIAYAGFGAYTMTSNYREFVGQTLSSPLILGAKYFCSFKVALAINPTQSLVFATNKMGIKFSMVPYSGVNPAPLTNSAKVFSTAIVTDTVNWTTIFGSFIADSAYQYLMIGNFFDNSQTDTLRITNTTFPPENYYYLDDICISSDSLLALNYVYTDINEINENISLNIFPNPTTSIFTVSTTGDRMKEIRIYNILGELIYRSEIKSQNTTIDLNMQAKGIYFVKVTDLDKNETTQKLVIQ